MGLFSTWVLRSTILPPNPPSRRYLPCSEITHKHPGLTKLRFKGTQDSTGIRNFNTIRFQQQASNCLLAVTLYPTMALAWQLDPQLWTTWKWPQFPSDELWWVTGFFHFRLDIFCRTQRLIYSRPSRVKISTLATKQWRPKWKLHPWLSCPQASALLRGYFEQCTYCLAVQCSWTLALRVL